AYLLNTIRRIISLRDHIHLQLGRPDRISFADHITKCTVSAELRIDGNQQIAEIGRLVDLPANRMYNSQKTGHFPNRVGHQYGLKIITESYAVTDTGSHSVDIFKYGGVFCPINIVRHDRPYISRMNQ